MGNANPKVRFVVGRAGHVVTHDITLTNKCHRFMATKNLIPLDVSNTAQLCEIKPITFTNQAKPCKLKTIEMDQAL